MWPWPAMPAACRSSQDQPLQGVLRHLWRDVNGNWPDHLLGCPGESDGGRAGRIVFSFGLPHAIVPTKPLPRVLHASTAIALRIRC